jgi:hypothetical protein
VEQPVRLMLDKSRGLVPGPELVTNGDFSSGTTGWTVDSPVTITVASGQATISRNSGTISQFPRQAIITAGKWYRVTFTVIARSHNVQVYLQDTVGSSTFVVNTTGTFTATLFAGSADALGFRIGPTGDVNATCTVDNISVRELPGNHATAPSDAARPVLRGRVNLLTATTTLATQSVTVVAAAHTLRFTGAGTITLSGTASGTFSAGTHSITPTAGSLTLTVSGTVTDADLRLTNDGVNLPPYQRVTTSTDYNTAGFPLYLAFDGTDDSMSTSAIDFSAGDKMTVFAGVRALSDTTGIIAELSATVNTNNGAFALLRNISQYLLNSRGTTTISATEPGTYTQPDSAVLTGRADISAQIAAIKRNAGNEATNTASQGTGNYGNHSLFIGSRNNASLRFNGRLYSLIVRGAASNAAQIAAAEAWVNGKTGAY